MVKLNQNSYLGHMTIPGGPSRFLPVHIPEISWISCGNFGNFLKISEIVPSLDRKRFPPWSNEK
jgi:hypothetical protein